MPGSFRIDHMKGRVRQTPTTRLPWTRIFSVAGGWGSGRSCIWRGRPPAPANTIRMHLFSPASNRYGGQDNAYRRGPARPLTSIKSHFAGIPYELSKSGLVVLTKIKHGLRASTLSLIKGEAHMAIKDILLPLVGEGRVRPRLLRSTNAWRWAGDMGARVTAMAVEEDILVRPKGNDLGRSG